jgi:hypothetical protein
MPIDMDYLASLLDEMAKADMGNMVQAMENVKPRVPEPLKNDEPKEPVRPKRCQGVECKAKILLSDFACQCKGFYCSKHRYAESHSCTFDYKAAGNKLLEKSLVKAVADKVDRI